ncbi:MAG: NUDIX hydrolase [bacterium]
MILTPEDIQQILKYIPRRKEIFKGFVPSAVLVIILNKSDRTHLIYIRRAQEMTLHSGQMAFPGGKIDQQDVSSRAAAVRETREEIGIVESQFTYLGEMGFFETLISRYDAAAHVVWSAQPFKYQINKREVAEVIEIPLDILLNQFRPDLDFDNAQELMYLNFKYQPPNTANEINLWGLTARITHHFLAGLVRFLDSKKHG